MGLGINGLEKDMSKMVIGIILANIVIVAGIILSLWIYMRKQYIVFTEEICDYVDQLINDSSLGEHTLNELNLDVNTFDVNSVC